jgi:hypothetical protein
LTAAKTAARIFFKNIEGAELQDPEEIAREIDGHCEALQIFQK